MVSYKNLFEMHLYVNIFHDDSQNSNRKIASPDHDKVFRLTTTGFGKQTVAS